MQNWRVISKTNLGSSRHEVILYSEDAIAIRFGGVEGIDVGDQVRLVLTDEEEADFVVGNTMSATFTTVS